MRINSLHILLPVFVEGPFIMVPESCGPIPVEGLSHFPTFCTPVLKDDDPALAIAINFWAVNPTGDAEADLFLGDLYGQETVAFIRAHDEPAFLGCVLMWMGARLLDDERCVGPLERGFLDRVRTDCPEAVDRFLMTYFQYHPEALN
jgi:hypothetical protein